MTFEEFIQKKKIDIALFKAGNNDLYTEFVKHFALMGEKSFDHTKKYLFNKLRHSFPLKEEPKAVEEKPIKTEAASSEKVLKSTLGFKPRFKAGKTNSPTETDAEKTQLEKDKENPSKPVYKPKFKPSAVKKAEKEETAKPESSPENLVEKNTAKQPYKPRFKPGVAKNKKGNADDTD